MVESVFLIHMVKALLEWEIQAREHAQQADIRRRKDFMHFSEPTQQKTLKILGTMTSFIKRGKPLEAQYYFFNTIHTAYRTSTGLTDSRGVDWIDVENAIEPVCFSDHDYEGKKIWPERVKNAYVIYTNLMKVK